MDSKVIIAIVAAVIVVGAAAGGAAFFLKHKDDDKHDSDFTLIDTIATDGIKGGLYYIYDISEKGYSSTVETVTAEETKSDDIHCLQTSDSNYDSYKDLFDMDRFKSLYFDFTDPSAVPTGVTCDKSSPSMFGLYTYTINGTGSRTVDSGSVTMTFDNVKIVTDGSDAEGASGSATVKGEYEINYNKYKVDIQESYSGSDFIAYATTTGTYHAEINLHFTSVDAYKAGVFQQIDKPSGVTPTKENHRGVEADKYVINGSYGGSSYDLTGYAYESYTMDISGTVDGDKVSVNVQIYYI